MIRADNTWLGFSTINKTQVFGDVLCHHNVLVLAIYLIELCGCNIFFFYPFLATCVLKTLQQLPVLFIILTLPYLFIFCLSEILKTAIVLCKFFFSPFKINLCPIRCFHTCTLFE